MTHVVFLSSITSDIGIALALRYLRDGFTVAGTYRSRTLLPQLAAIPQQHLFYCDLADPTSVESAAREFGALGLRWDTFISLASWPPPLAPFFESDFDQWRSSVMVNAVEQVHALHSLGPFRAAEGVQNAIFFAGPGTNSAVKNFSALTLSKLMLIKFCELLDAEDPALNAFIVGPGWTRTKTHDLIISDPNVSAEKRAETVAFLASQVGTSMDEIYESIRWLSEQGRTVAGGRNFSVVHDAWGTDELALALTQDPDMYKLRRHGNQWKPGTITQ